MTASNLAVPMSPRIYATDASNQMGGIASTEVPIETARALWRSADKKGKNVPLLPAKKALLREYDHEFEEEDENEGYDEDIGEKAPRPIGLSFDFVEVFGGLALLHSTSATWVSYVPQFWTFPTALTMTSRFLVLCPG